MKRKLLQELARRKRWRSTKRLHGPEQVRLSDTDVMVTVLARNSEWFMRTLLDYHFALGARHVLVIDNGSTDATVDVCRGYDRVTVLQSLLPAKIHESAFRSEFSQQVAKGGWVLFVDSDELVELPFAGPNALDRLTTYCNEHDYTAVVGHLLDRFSTDSYEKLRGLDYPESIRLMKYYSVKYLEAVGYNEREKIDFNWHLRNNYCADPKVSFQRGGIRTELFGEMPFLSKHALVRNRTGVELMTHPHCASNVKVADLTLLIHHYKLAGDWISRDKVSVREEHWQHGGNIKRLAAIGNIPEGYHLTAEEPLLWRGIEPLYEEGFIYASPSFRQVMDVAPQSSDKPRASGKSLSPLER